MSQHFNAPPDPNATVSTVGNLIGRCDWCGLVDHHLVDGECPACIERRERATRLADYGDVPLGEEAATPAAPAAAPGKPSLFASRYGSVVDVESRLQRVRQCTDVDVLSEALQWAPYLQVTVRRAIEARLRRLARRAGA